MSSVLHELWGKLTFESLMLIIITLFTAEKNDSKKNIKLQRLFEYSCIQHYLPEE